jgi:hypothetical protein
MGFDSGSSIGGKGKNGACRNVDGKNHCGKNKLKIMASVNNCKGSEDKI